MATPAYVQLDRNKPDGANNPTTYSADDLANERAIADSVVLLRSDGWIETRTQGTGPDLARPQYLIFAKGTLVLRKTFTWTGYNPTTVQYEWSNDSGATWANIGSAQVNTFDANQNITATTNSGGSNSWVMEIWAKCLKAVADIAAHMALTGSSAHALGTISTQASTAVNIDGGTIDGTKIGSVVPEDVDATRVREKFNDYGSIAAAGTVTLEVDKYAHFAFTPHATTSNTLIIAMSGAPAAGLSQTFMVEIINGRRSADAKITYPASWKWIGGAASRPLDTVLELAGRNFISGTTRDGGVTWDVMHLGKRG